MWIWQNVVWLLEQANTTVTTPPKEALPTNPAQPSWKHTPALLAGLAAENVVLKDSTIVAHEKAMNAGASSAKVFRRKGTTHKYSLYNFPQIGPSIPVKKLGAGFYGKVKKHVSEDGEVFAVKSIKYWMMMKKDANEFFTGERNALAAFGLLKGSDFGSAAPSYNGYFFEHGFKGRLAMLFYEGQTLTEYVLSARYVSSLQSILLMIGLVDAIAPMHQKNYLHNDAHIGNFMTADGRNVVPIDYGLARPIGTRKSSIGGWMSLYCHDVPTVQDEIQSLGVSFLFLIRRSLPLAAPLLYAFVIKDMIHPDPSKRPPLATVRQNLVSLFNTISLTLSGIVGLSIGLAFEFGNVNVLSECSVPKQDQHRDLMSAGLAIFSALLTFCASYWTQKPYRTFLLSKSQPPAAENKPGTDNHALSPNNS